MGTSQMIKEKTKYKLDRIPWH